MQIAGIGLSVLPYAAFKFCGAQALFAFAFSEETGGHNYAYVWMAVAIVVTLVTDIVLIKSFYFGRNVINKRY